MQFSSTDDDVETINEGTQNLTSYYHSQEQVNGDPTHKDNDAGQLINLLKKKIYIDERHFSAMAHFIRTAWTAIRLPHVVSNKSVCTMLIKLCFQ